MHVAQGQIGGARLGHIGGLGGAGDRGGTVQQFVNPRQVRRCGLPHARQVPKAAHRLKGQRHRAEKAHEFANGLVARDDVAPAHQQHKEKAQTGDDIDHRGDGAADRHQLDLGAHDPFDDALIAAHLIGLHPVQLDRADAVEHLVQTGGTVAGLFAHMLGLAPDIALRHGGRHDQQRNADQGQKRPFRGHRHRHRKQRDQGDNIAPRAGNDGRPDVLNRHRVALDAFDQRAGRVGLIEPRL